MRLTNEHLSFLFYEIFHVLENKKGKARKKHE